MEETEEQIQKNETYKLSAQQQKCIDTIVSFEQFYNFKNNQSLVRIFLSKPLSLAFFDSNKVQISSLFGGNQKEEKQQSRTKLFSKKYSFERLCQKFIHPKGTLTLFRNILGYKLKSQYIDSHNTRKNIWLLASGAKHAMKLNKGVYKSLIDMTNYPESYTKAIDLDLNRTAPNQTPQNMAALRRMLVAFSRKNPFIGYCQGLNFIAYFILTMQFQQQEGFWLLVQLLEIIIPMDYYTNMIGVVTDQRIFLQMLRQHNPRIGKKFNEVGLDPSVFTIQWLVCLYTSSVPFYLVQIIWDRLIIEGTSALLKTGIIILEQFQSQIMKATDFPDIIILVEQGSKKFSLSQLQFNLKYEKIYVNKRILQVARDMYRQLYVKQKLAEKIGKVINTNLFKNIKCNRDWPVCLQVLQKNKKQRQDCLSWTFRRVVSPSINNNYLDSVQYTERSSQSPTKQTTQQDSQFTLSRQNSSKQQHIDPQQLVIGRMMHICPQNPQPSPQNSPTRTRPKIRVLSKSQYGIPPQRQQQQQPQQVSSLSFLQSQQITQKKVQKLRSTKSMFFYQKFIFNNKQLGQIIANESMKQNDK